ncbi:replication fork protection component [Grosmannia clavigera kw1407]|uniref:Chromosome segregation in meiosis protein n=1 Tax=Grosmannia clavigera (strain kw1407 / UAMH 11150) TaxID=655863 RepID=F0XB00_GROCL|nr:replication fork protection component [Grosmannia clavigera kw1407]EFX05138.1 replication fork protection component [Grosmannia clavigera kw1407]
MASDVRRPQAPPSAGGFEDYLPDDLADYGSLFGDEQDGADKSGKSKKAGGDVTAGLGIDEEVDVKKRAREPRVKLDETRILSAKGIPALRQRARNLKLKGKGHEFADASRLLSMYQLWLDDLFPKARFGDALAMVEKEGHKASMHKMRMEWINESKPRDHGDSDAEGQPGEHEDAQPAQQSGPRPSVPSQGEKEPLQPQTQTQTQPQPQAAPQPQPQPRPRQTGTSSGDPMEEDLLDEDLYGASPVRPSRRHEADEVPDEDELDALMAEAAEAHEQPPAQPPVPTQTAMDDMGDMDELDALMAEAEAAS